MKKISYILPLAAAILLGAGCKKYLNVNTDPNNPADVQENLLLVSTETAISTTLAGGALTIGNYTSIGQVTAYWTQQTALNQLPPQNDVYRVRPDDMDQQWLEIYSTIFQNLQLLNNKAEGHGNHAYGVIAKVLTAYTLGIVTDMHGDVPWSKALNGALHPVYDKQEDIYKTLHSILDSAILESSLDPGLFTPSSDEFIYGGDITLWKKFAYSLKARYYMHLTKAPGYNAVTQSGLALTALQNGFSSQAEEASFAAYKGDAGSESPWYENILPANGPVVLASTFVDFLKGTNDPRLPLIATKNKAGGYAGRVIGTDPAPNQNVYSNINDFYGASNSPQSLFNYSEVLFLRAEAIFRTSGAAAATPFYISAIKSHMYKLGLDTASAPALAYIATRSPLTTGNGIQRIMEEKSIANFLDIENFNDWRRTGFPVLSIVLSPYVPTIPRRFPYPLAEVTSNPQPQQNLAITDRVWWDAP